MPIELIAALHAGWRNFWRNELAYLAGVAVILAGTAVSLAMVHQGLYPLAQGIPVGIGSLIGVAISVWISVRILSRCVFWRPFTVRGKSYAFMVLLEGIPQPNPLRSKIAWGIFWGILWRGFLLVLPFYAFSFGSQGELTDPATSLHLVIQGELLWGPVWLLLDVLSFWWLIHRSYGRLSIQVVASTTPLEGIKLLPSPIKDGHAS